jgi:2-octaprenyl-6-methoxyphenol hydroxylase
VSERGSFGVTRFDHTEQGVEALGYVIVNRALGQCLYTLISQQKNVTVIMPAHLRAYRIDHEGVTVTVERGSASDNQQMLELRSRLLVAADGSGSEVRKQAGIDVRRLNYDQSAIVANVTPQQHHRYVAYERFTDSGPLALLPMSEGRCSLIWSNSHNDVESLLALSDGEFLQRLQHRFGYRLGKFIRVGERNAYPLSLVLARDVVSSRIALLGNAAHSIHPVAGQGFNLALRDVAALAQLLIDVGDQDAGGEAVLREFACWRQDDLRKTIRFTDGLARLFTNPLLQMTPLRGIGLVALDLLPPLRRMFARQTMGIAGRLTRLAAGQALRIVPHQEVRR